jgi:hypothetical protein
MQSEGNASKNGEPTVGFFSFMTMLRHIGHFWSRISLQRTMWEQWSIPAIFCWLGSSWFLPVPLPKISTEGTMLWWCYWHNRECNGRGDKAFTKWLPGTFPTPLQSLVEVYGCTRGLLGKKRSLNDCIVMYFSEIKWFQEHLEATTYYLCSMVMTTKNIYLPTVFMCVQCNIIPHRVTQLNVKE